MKFLIDFKNTTSQSDIDTYLSNNNCTILKDWDNFEKIYLVETGTIPSVTSIVDKIVEEVGLKVKPLDFIVDSFQYSHLNPNLEQLTLSTSDTQDWWKVYTYVKPDFENASMTITRKGEGINVYMMDSGIQISHPEFAEANVVNLYTVTPDDFNDLNGHGTALSSVVVGKTCGITNATLKVVKIFDPNHDTMQSEFLDALDAIANDHNTNTFGVVNCSWVIEKNDWIEHKLSLLIDQGLYVICAAGNQGTEIQNVTPAGMLRAVTVGAYNQNLDPCNFSNFTGTTIISTTNEATNHGSLDGWAPGEQIYAAGMNGTYGYVAGTSIASAISSAVCASNLSDLLKDDLTKDYGYENYVVAPDSNTAMFMVFSRMNLLNLSDPKYSNSKNKIATLRDNSHSPVVQIPDEVSMFIKVGEKKAMAKLFVHYLTEKIEWIDPLPPNFYLMNEGNVYGEPTEINAPAAGEDYKLYQIRYKRYSTNGTVENCQCEIYVANSNFDTNSVPQDHPISISLQNVCSGFPTVCSLSASPLSCTSSCISGGVCCAYKYFCDCTEFGGGGTCFAGETLITMADGSKKQIKDIIEGDVVLAHNLSTGQDEPNTVCDIHVRGLRNLYEYTLDNGKTLIATDDHPLYVVNKGWASMNPGLSVQGYKSLTGRIKEIEIGDDLFCAGNTQAKIVNIQVKTYSGKVYTFNNINKSSPTYYANDVLTY